MLDDDDFDPEAAGATRLGELARDGAFDPGMILWRCPICNGVFWSFEQPVIVGVEIIDHPRWARTDGPAVFEPSEEQLEAIRRRTEIEAKNDRHNAALYALSNASPPCRCRASGLGTQRPGDDG
jgi:hypothetical protein